MPDHFSQTNHFHDFEIFTATLRSYDLDIRQLDQGRFSATLQQTASGAVLLSHFVGTRRLEIQGNPPAGFRTFGIPTGKCLPFIWRDKHSDGNTIQLYRDVTELEMVTQPFFEAIDLSIPEDTLNQLCQTLGYPELDKIIGDAEMLRCDPEHMRILRNALHRTCLVLSDHPAQINTVRMQKEIELELPRLLLHAIQSTEAQALFTLPEKRQRALKKAVDYIKAYSTEPITLHDLCQETQVSDRTLQHAFLDHFGLSPKAYLRARRLNNVHKELFSADPVNTRIAEVAHAWGFWHMGQFAADYRRQFGELPSRTLSKNL